MKNTNLLFFAIVSVLFCLFSLTFDMSGIFGTDVIHAAHAQSNQIIVTQPVPSDGSNLQLRTFTIITFTPSPIPSHTTTTSNTGSPIPVTSGPKIGGPVPPAGYYCIDDQDPDMCDDNSSYLVPKGTTGAEGTCGFVIDWSHKLVDSLPQYMKGLRNSLNSAVASPSCNYTASATAAPNYISTYFVIDAYNLAGYHELSRSNPAHVSPSGLFSWWNAQPTGYTFMPYSASVLQQFGSGQNDLTGCVMFLKLASGSYHIGIVNRLELFNTNGDGVISILQSGTRMYIDRFPVVGWNIQNTSTNQTNTNGVAGFGCHQ